MQISRCPYCGYVGGRFLRVFEDRKDFQVICRVCSARGPIEDTEEGAIYEWNVVANSRESFVAQCNAEES
jgi:hypothetical protein